MRDIKRIRKFCNELADIWEEYCPDWRFGQLMCNVLGEMSAEKDPFFPEEKEMMDYFKKFFNVKNNCVYEEDNVNDSV